jgi:hypothetical protein
MMLSDVTGSSFLTSRVGCTLKSGFKLGGRQYVLCYHSSVSANSLHSFKYEFLAYSSSALKEHSVWFVRPFPNTEAYAEWHDPGVHMIDAHEIRTTLGDFTGVSKQPAKYAARMAQAFTATDPSVKIRREQWEEVKDLGQAPYEHTDGKCSCSFHITRSAEVVQVLDASPRTSPMRFGRLCAGPRHIWHRVLSSRRPTRFGEHHSADHIWIRAEGTSASWDTREWSGWMKGWKERG